MRNRRQLKYFFEKTFYKRNKEYLMRKRTIVALICLLFSTPLLAVPLDKKEVAAEAKWLLHLDLDAFHTSQFGTLVLDEVKAEHQDQIDAFKELFGVDLTQDITSLTAYGVDADEDNTVALFHGTFDRQKLTTLLKLNPNYSSMEYDNHTIHFWKEKESDDLQAGAFAANGVITICHTEEAIKTAIDVLSGKNKSLDADPDDPLYNLTQQTGSPIIIAATDSLSELTDDDNQAAVLKNSKMLAVLAAEDDGQLTLSIELVTENAEAATQIEQILRGVIAFASLETNDKSDMGPLKALLQNLSLSRTDNQLNLNFSYPSADLFELLKSADDLDIDLDLDDFDVDIDFD